MALQVEVTNVFGRNLEAYNSGKRVIINQGGSRSSKSFSIDQLLICIAKKEKVSISIVSCAFPHLRRGVMRDFMLIMDQWGMYNPERHTKTEHIYNFENGSYVEFFSVDNALKVRGPGRDILFINEANLIEFDTFTQLALRTKKTIFLDFNPAEEFNYIYEKLEPREDAILIKSTYLDNPFLPHEQVKEIENLRNVDENFWRIYGEGERGHSEGVIYTHWSSYSGSINGPTVYGLDFGYNNPSSLVRVTENDQNLYWKEEIYQSGLTTNDLIPMIKQIVKPHEPVYCDAAEPDRILDLQRAGIKALAANKNVKDGIDFIKSRKLFIHNQSANMLKEIKSYKYLTKQVGITEVPLKLNDHAMDAGRYASISFKKPKSTGLHLGFHKR